MTQVTSLQKKSHHVFWVAECHRNVTVDDSRGRVIVGTGKSFLVDSRTFEELEGFLPKYSKIATRDLQKRPF